MASPTVAADFVGENIFFIEAVGAPNLPREIFGTKPSSDFPTFDDPVAGCECSCIRPARCLCCACRASTPLIVSRWAQLRTYVLDKAFNLDPCFSDFAIYAPYMEPESEVSTDVEANHVDTLASTPVAGKMPTQVEIEKFPVGRVVLCTVENGIGFFVVREKIITPGGWIWGKAVVEKILTQTHFASVEIASSGPSTGEAENQGVVSPTEVVPIGVTIEAIDEQAQETLRKFDILSAPISESPLPPSEVPLSEALSVSPDVPSSPSSPAISEVATAVAQESGGSRGHYWMPPTHFLERFSEVEAQLQAVKLECERLKEIAASGSTSPPPSVERKVSGSKIAMTGAPAGYSFGTAITEEFFKFDRSTLKKVGDVRVLPPANE